MFFHDDELQFPVRVEKPDPIFAKMLQQAIGGLEGEMRIMNQYLFQAWSLPPEMGKYRRLLMETATEEIGHVEMLATAVAKNLEGAPVSLRNRAASDPIVRATLAGEMPRHFLSGGNHALPVDANGAPFNAVFVAASGNLAADMYANLSAETTGRLLVTRLWEMTDDEGMKEMLGYLIARDGMHQNQWLTVLKEMGDHLPVPASFPLDKAHPDFNYAFLTTGRDGAKTSKGPWNEGTSFDGKGELSIKEQPGGGPADLPSTPKEAHNDIERAVKAIDKEIQRRTS